MEQNKLIIDVLSDTHGKHGYFKLEGGDILLHSGDVSSRGSDQEILDFINWFEQQDYTHRVFIPGNHDWSLERNFAYWKDECDKRGIILLNDSGVTLTGSYVVEEHSTVREGGVSIERYDIKVWGSPVQPWFHSWAFNRARTEAEAKYKHRWIKPHWDLIPEDTEILLTHGPPMKILDEVTTVMGTSYNPPQHVGCEELSKRLAQLHVKLHLFGHIHEGRGFQYEGETTYVNGSSLDRMYMPADKKPMRVSREVFQDGSIGYVL